VQAALALFAVRRYRQGITTDFRSGYDPDIFGDGDRYRAPYSGPSDAYQGGGGDYRESPFADPQTAGKTGDTGGGYQAVQGGSFLMVLSDSLTHMGRVTLIYWLRSL